MKSEEDLDNLFKKSMDDPANHRAFNEDDWDAFEQMLDAGKKHRRVVYWLPRASAVAAMLILALGWWFFIKPVKVDNGLAGVKPTKGNNGNAKPLAGDTDVNKSSQDNNQATAHTKDTIWNKQPDANKLTATKTQRDSLLHTQSAANGLTVSQGKQKPLTERKLIAPSVNSSVTGVKPDGDLATRYQQIAGTNKSAGSTSRTQLFANSMAFSNTVTDPLLSAPDFKTEIDMPVAAVQSAGKPAKKIIKQGFGYRPQLAITALASSDVNSTSAFQGKAGSNYGALLSVGVTRRLTITSGVVYSSKPYNTSFANYNSAYVFKHAPNDVTADCKMLDIPINIGYQIAGNFRNKFSVGTGLSSYIMLHEKYTFNYTDGNNPAWPQSYTVPNSKGYYLSILNINATYERKINSNFGISVQPYMKVPLSGVGYSDLKLQSTGVAVGVIYNINAFRKP